MSIEILDRQGRRVFQADDAVPAESFDRDRGTTRQWRLPLEALATGPHLLSVIVRVAAGVAGPPIEARRELPFEVR
jgi:hypothetical protein